MAKAPRVRFTGVSSILPPRGSIHLQFEVENGADTPLPYAGYLPQPADRPNPAYSIHPIYTLQYERKGGWKPHPLGWCGTGTGPVRLSPQSKNTFLVTVPLDDWQALKAGITWYPSEDRNDPQVAWSDAVSRKRLALPPDKRVTGRKQASR
jgi:hypothetical protein